MFKNNNNKILSQMSSDSTPDTVLGTLLRNCEHQNGNNNFYLAMLITINNTSFP